MIRFDEHIPQRQALDLTPLIDVVFNLLVFFVLTSAFAQPSLPLNLPEAETSAVRETRAIRVEVRSREELRVDGKAVAWPDLVPLLQNVFRQDPEKELELASDQATPFGIVVEVMDVAKKAGAKNIAVITEPKKQ